MLIVGFKVCGFDVHLLIKQMNEKTSERDSKEAGVLVLQLIQVCIFDGVGDFILECLIHFTCIIVDSPSFVMLKLELTSEGYVGVPWFNGVYFWVRRVGSHRGREGVVEICIHYDANVPVVSSSL